MKRFEFSLLLAVIFCIALSFFSFEEECAEIRENVLRLHILANSDSEEDQQLKLMVRDSVIAASEEIFADCRSLEEAKAAVIRNLDIIEMTAENTLAQNGCFYDVSVELADSWFSTRTYGNITLPAGVYEAVRISIGEAKGHNWWCVMFPAVCLPSASGEAELGSSLTAEQVQIVCGDGYELKFRCVELYEQLLEEMRQAHLAEVHHYQRG